jgi:hypothetical protein
VQFSSSLHFATIYYEDLHTQTLACLEEIKPTLKESIGVWRMLTCADVCWRMLTYADLCWPDVCWRVLTRSSRLFICLSVWEREGERERERESKKCEWPYV